MSALAVSEMMPGSFCKSLAELLLVSAGPLHANPSVTPAATVTPYGNYLYAINRNTFRGAADLW